MVNKITTNQFKQEVYNLVGNEYTVLGEYVNNNTKILMRHNKCGYEYEVTPKNFKSNGRRCPKCSGKLKLTTNQFKQEVYNLVGNEYTVLGEYVNNNTKILMRHNKCGYEYEVTPNRFKQGNRCPKCANINKLNRIETLKSNLDQFKQEVYNLVGNEYTVLGEYVNNNTKILMRHNKCGYEYSVKPNNFKQGRRCPKCANKLKISTNTIKKIIYDLVGDEYIVLSEYTNTNNKILMKHNKCGCEWYITPNNFKNKGERCPNCANTGEPSKLEIECLDFIKSFYTKEIKTSCTNILSNHKELDIYIPDKNIAIEFDGLYWHSDKFKDKNYHLNKTIECLSKGIQLIHIFEDEWINKQEIVKSKLKYTLHKSKELPKIRASKCFISELSTSDKNQFLNENHIQGEDKANIKLGLWYPINDEEDRLIAVMTFCKPRKALGQSKESKYDYELSRFATDIEYQVYGAFDKLFKYFKENYEWNSVITYADRRWSKGGLYENTGFKHPINSKTNKIIKCSKPNYWYCINQNKYHRFGFRKSELKKKFPDLYDENNTEFEIMDKTNYTRIWDCGNLVYEYKRDKG